MARKYMYYLGKIVIHYNFGIFDITNALRGIKNEMFKVAIIYIMLYLIECIFYITESLP